MMSITHSVFCSKERAWSTLYEILKVVNNKCSGTWIRTKILASKGRCPTIRRSRKLYHAFAHSMQKRRRAAKRLLPAAHEAYRSTYDVAPGPCIVTSPLSSVFVPKLPDHRSCCIGKLPLPLRVILEPIFRRLDLHPLDAFPKFFLRDLRLLSHANSFDQRNARSIPSYHVALHSQEPAHRHEPTERTQHNK